MLCRFVGGGGGGGCYAVVRYVVVFHDVAYLLARRWSMLRITGSDRPASCRARVYEAHTYSVGRTFSFFGDGYHYIISVSGTI